MTCFNSTDSNESKESFEASICTPKNKILNIQNISPWQQNDENTNKWIIWIVTFLVLLDYRWTLNVKSYSTLALSIFKLFML